MSLNLIISVLSNISAQGVTPIDTIITQSIFSENDYNSDLTVGAGWTQNTDRLSSGTADTCDFDIMTLSEQQGQKLEFKLTNTNTIFRIYKKPFSSSFDGLLVEVDFTNLLLKVYDPWDGVSLPALKGSTPITIPVDTNQRYTIDLSMVYYDIGKLILTGSGSDILNFTYNHSIIRDYAGFEFVSGGVDFYNWIHYSKTVNPCKGAYFGDSWVDGFSLLSEPASPALKWTYLSYLDNNSQLISGRGGENSTDLNTRISLELAAFAPEYVIVCTGYNDTVLGTFQANIDAIILKINNAGYIPILATLAPVSGTANAAISDDQNTYIKSRGERLLNISEVMTVGGDEATINPALILADNSHPNTQGHSDIYDRLKIEVPELFL